MSPLVIIFLTVFIDLLGFGIIIPLLPFYAERFGATAFTVGLISTSFSLMQFVWSPLWGRLSDRVGRRPIILLGLAGSCASYLMLALADSLPLLFAARILGGIAGANIPTAQAYIADITTTENRAKGMGMVGAAFGLGFIFGPAIGGLLSRFGPSTPMWVASALCGANLLAAWWLLPESHTTRDEARPALGRLEALRRALGDSRLTVLLALYFLVTAAFSGFESTFALFSERRFGFTVGTLGYLFAFAGVTTAVVQGALVGRAVNRLGEARLIPLGMTAIAVGLLLIPAAGSVPMLLLAVATLSAGSGFNGPSLSSMVSKLTHPDDQGGMLGLASSLSSLGRVVGPAWGGWLFDHYGIGAPYVSSALILLMSVGVAVTRLRRV